ncbi:unnamed protein product [Polarella glacialis]|uniref:Uncharacterized protein n=1 Tax=Polarella glacialis TaxID=89957 RepID=A0A813GAI5_POLGL|nr:unnamed protein product [Polarella glacialis]
MFLSYLFICVCLYVVANCLFKLRTAKTKDYVPICLPSTTLWHVPSQRLVLGRLLSNQKQRISKHNNNIDDNNNNNISSGRELLRFQGLRYPEMFLDKCSEGLLGDLAVNAFAATCCLAAMLAILTSMEFETTSENEENDDISALLGMMSRSS